MTAASVAVLSVWRLRRRDVPAALVQVASARRGRLSEAGLVFARLLGTAGDRFTPRDAQPTRWALLTAWTDSSAATGWESRLRWWDDRAVESASMVMRPVCSRGNWDGAQPFGDGTIDDSWRGPVVALTRSTLRPRKAAAFYRSVPAVAAALRGAPGLRLSFAIGETPLLRQGTVSVWDSATDMRAFAHRTAAHAHAVRMTPRIGWYSEEMFSRFALVSATGSIDGRAVTP
jgi:heme-degrading monooxygenase HmoA